MVIYVPLEIVANIEKYKQFILQKFGYEMPSSRFPNNKFPMEHK